MFILKLCGKNFFASKVFSFQRDFVFAFFFSFRLRFFFSSDEALAVDTRMDLAFTVKIFFIHFFLFHNPPKEFSVDRKNF